MSWLPSTPVWSSPKTSWALSLLSLLAGQGWQAGDAAGERRAERCRGSTSSLPNESRPKRMGNAWALLAFSSGRALVISFSSAQSLFFHRTCSYSMSLKPLYQICRGGFGFFSLFFLNFFLRFSKSSWWKGESRGEVARWTDVCLFPLQRNILAVLDFGGLSHDLRIVRIGNTIHYWQAQRVEWHKSQRSY